jgi:hypothetical protein
MWTKGECSSEEFYDAIVSEYTQLFNVSNPTFCQKELTQGYPTFIKIVGDVKTSNWGQLTLDAIQFINEAEGAYEDCAPLNTTRFSAGNDTDACFNDTEDIFKEMFDIYQMYQSGDINPLALVTMIEKIVTDGQHMISECGNLQDIIDAGIDTYVKLFNPVNATACRSNLNDEWIQVGLVT